MSVPARDGEKLCSTPYGIKGIGTAFHLFDKRRDLPVLNALRHQRNWNAKKIENIQITPPGVLNALRHQRNWNISTGQIYPVEVCVLNALRHQRNWNSRKYSQEPGIFRGAQRLTASKELEPTVTYPPHCDVYCAQRLTASKELEP